MVISNITKCAIKTGNIIQVTLLTNVTCYVSNIVAVMNLILCNIVITSNKVTNLILSFLFITKICTLSNNAIMSCDKVVVSHMTA